MPSALVIGDAACRDADVEAALKLFQPDAICCASMSGIKWPGRVDYWVTLHPNPADPWPGMVSALSRRQKAGLNRPQTWAHKPGAGIDRSTADWRGSTGLLCVKVLIVEEGFDRIVLAGMPLNAAGAHYYDPAPWRPAHLFHKGWEAHRAEIAPFTRSLSGWTQEFLGPPTIDWFKPEPGQP